MSKSNGIGENSEEEGWEGWGHYMNAKRQKLSNQFRETAPPLQSTIFQGVTIFVNGYTYPSADVLRRIMQTNGGDFTEYPTRDITHTIATNLAQSKIAKLRPDEKIMKPEWITDSLASGKLLPEADYRKYFAKSELLKYFTVIKPGSSAAATASGSTNGQNSAVNNRHLNGQAAGPPQSSKNSGPNGVLINGCPSVSRAASSASSSSSTNQRANGHAKADQQLSTAPRLQQSSRPNGNNDFDQDENASDDDDISMMMPKLTSTPQANGNAAATSRKGPSNFDDDEDVSFDSDHAVFAENAAETEQGPSTTTNAAAAVSNGYSRAIPKTTDPNFLTDFYANSRLHFISTLAQEMKAYVQRLRAAQLETDDEFVFEGRQRLFERFGARNGLVAKQPTNSKAPKQGDFKSVFMHIDMDCFFVSVGIRSKPHLKGKPIAVTHSKGKGPAFGGLNGTRAAAFNSRAEIASCNYEARACGISNGMYLGEAQKRCPNLEAISYSFEEYQEVSKILYDTVAEYTLNIEAISCDELYADLTELAREMSLHAIELSDVVASIRADIRQRTECPASAGLGPNMLVARLATRKAKPDGQFIVRPEEVENFMQQQKVKDIPGVGPATLDKLEPFGIELCEELLCYTLSDLQKEFGAKAGQLLFNASRGKDERTIKDETIRKSISCDVNYGIRFQNEAEVSIFLDSLSTQMESRMLNANVKGRHLTLKLLIRAKNAPVETPKFLGCGQCDARTHSTLLPAATNNSRILAFECKKLVRHIAPVITDVRGVGMSLHKLESQLTAKPTSQVGRIDGFLASKSDVGLGKSKITPSLSAQPSTSAAVTANSVQSASRSDIGPDKSKAIAAQPAASTTVASKSAQQASMLDVEPGKSTIIPALAAQPTSSATVASKSAQQASVPDVGLGRGKATPILSAQPSTSRVANRSAQQSSRLGDFRRDLFGARGAQQNSVKAASTSRNEPDFSAACRPTTSTGAATISKAPPPSVSSKADVKKKKDDNVNDEAKNYVQVIRTLFSDLRSMELPKSINDLDPEVLKVLTLEMREAIKDEIAERAAMALRVEKQRVERTNFKRGIFGVSTPSKKPGAARPAAAPVRRQLSYSASTAKGAKKGKGPAAKKKQATVPGQRDIRVALGVVAPSAPRDRFGFKDRRFGLPLTEEEQREFYEDEACRKCKNTDNLDPAIFPKKSKLEKFCGCENLAGFSEYLEKWIGQILEPSEKQKKRIRSIAKRLIKDKRFDHLVNLVEIVLRHAEQYQEGGHWPPFADSLWELIRERVKRRCGYLLALPYQAANWMRGCRLDASLEEQEVEEEQDEEETDVEAQAIRPWKGSSYSDEVAPWRVIEYEELENNNDRLDTVEEEDALEGEDIID